MASQPLKPVWVALLDVQPLPRNDSLEGQFGAYVHVLAPAHTWEEFCASARRLLEREGWRAVEAHDIQPADQADLSGDLRSIADAVMASQRPAHAGTFYSYPDADEAD